MSKPGLAFWMLIGVLVYFGEVRLTGGTNPPANPVPQAWGTFRGHTVMNQLIFEDRSGTIRIVDTRGVLRYTIVRK